MTKFKENFKNFWSLQKKNTGGFTLVELIVVIAILAILAGIAVPAYSGYVEKAEKAADEQLLATVNTAFASACAINGDDINLVESATAVLDDDKTVEAVYRTAIDDEYSKAFSQFFAGNEEAYFKVINSLVFDAGLHIFVDPSNVSSLTIAYGGNTITVSGEAIQTLQNSTFGSVMGGEYLLEEIIGLTNMMGASGSNLATDLLQDEAYMASFAKYLGYTGDLEDQTAVQNFIMAQQESNGGNLTNDQLSNAMINGMVFYAAEGMKDYTIESATKLLNSDNIYSSLSADSATRLAEASLVYGMYAGFVNSDYNKGGAERSTADPMAAIQAISGSGEHSANFQEYLDSDQGQADVKAYMEAMDVINNASDNGAGASVLVNGFSDSELANLLTQVLGK